jgi:hypothetical protein
MKQQQQQQQQQQHHLNNFGGKANIASALVNVNHCRMALVLPTIVYRDSNRLEVSAFYHVQCSGDYRFSRDMDNSRRVALRHHMLEEIHVSQYYSCANTIVVLAIVSFHNKNA